MLEYPPRASKEYIQQWPPEEVRGADKSSVRSPNRLRARVHEVQTSVHYDQRFNGRATEGQWRAAEDQGGEYTSKGIIGHDKQNECTAAEAKRWDRAES